MLDDCNKYGVWPTLTIFGYFVNCTMDRAWTFWWLFDDETPVGTLAWWLCIIHSHIVVFQRIVDNNVVISMLCGLFRILEIRSVKCGTCICPINELFQ